VPPEGLIADCQLIVAEFIVIALLDKLIGAGQDWVRPPKIIFGIKSVVI
jgi:hypothetical protein